MGLILLVVACAALVGRLCGGRLARLGDGPVRGWRLLAIGMPVEVLAVATDAVGGPSLPTGTVNGVALILCGALIAVFCLANRGVQGVGLVGMGLVLNVLVVGLNGAMPVSRHALRRAGASVPGFDQVRHIPADHRTALRPLGDIVPVPLPGHPEADSLGDLLVAAGMAQFVLTGMLHRARLPGPPPRPARRPGVPRPEPSWTGSQRRQRSSAQAAARVARPSYRGRDGVVDADSELVRVITEPPEGVRPDPG